MFKLLKFILNISYKSVSLLANIGLLILLPFVILTISLTTNNDAASLSLIWMSIYVLLTITLVIGLVIKIITKTKYNAIDSILYSKEFSKFQIFGIKMLYITGCIFIVNIIAAFLMLITLGIAENINVGASYFGGIIVISLMICITVLPLTLIFSLKFNEILSTSLNFILLIIFTISCLLPLLITTTNNNKISYDPAQQQINYTKFNYIDNNNQNNLLCIIEYAEGNQNTNTDYANNINSIDVYVNFLPGQWLLAPISDIFVNNSPTVNLDNIPVNNMSIIRAEQNYTYAPSKYIDKADPINNVFINAGDQDIFQINYTTLLENLKQKLTTIFQENDTNTFINLYDKLNNLAPGVTDLGLVSAETALLRKLFGYEQAYNDLFYFGLYINSFYDAYQSLITDLQSSTDKAFVELISHIWSVNEWREYIYFNQQVNDFNFIKQRFFIPININDDIAPTATNVAQVKNELIVVNEDLSSIKLLTQANTYINISKTEFNNIFNGINNQAQWDAYIDTKTNTLLDFKLLYKDISRLNSKVADVIYLPNEIRTDNIKFMQELKYVTYLNNSAVITVLIILCGLLLWGFAIKIHQNTNFAI